MAQTNQETLARRLNLGKAVYLLSMLSKYDKFIMNLAFCQTKKTKKQNMADQQPMDQSAEVLILPCGYSQFCNKNMSAAQNHFLHKATLL